MILLSKRLLLPVMTFDCNFALFLSNNFDDGGFSLFVVGILDRHG
jgi:hypothetical protein